MLTSSHMGVFSRKLENQIKSEAVQILFPPLHGSPPGFWSKYRLSSSNKRKYRPYRAIFSFVAGQGLEPRFPGPEPGVLPLDDPARDFFK